MTIHRFELWKAPGAERIVDSRRRHWDEPRILDEIAGKCNGRTPIDVVAETDIFDPSEDNRPAITPDAWALMIRQPAGIEEPWTRVSRCAPVLEGMRRVTLRDVKEQLLYLIVRTPNLDWRFCTRFIEDFKRFLAFPAGWAAGQAMSQCVLDSRFLEGIHRDELFNVFFVPNRDPEVRDKSVPSSEDLAA